MKELKNKCKDLAEQVDLKLRECKQALESNYESRIVIVGPPNVGKSSLMNVLAGEEVAIVSHLPGTTRDTIRSDVAIAGRKVKVFDTAGIRETENEIEKIGVEKSR